MSTLELHPLCTLFPRLNGAEFEALKADIVANGQHEPITVYEGQILDGGNRYRACIEAGIEPTLKNFEGSNPASFVFSANFHRRHLTSGQQAVIVAQAQNWAKAQQVGRPEKSGSTAELKTVADRVAESGASDRAQRMADQLARQAPELAKDVAEGKISLPKAHAQLTPKAAPKSIPQQPRATAVQAPSVASPRDDVSRAGPVEVVTSDVQDDETIDDEHDDFVSKLVAENIELQAKLAEATARVAEVEALLQQSDLAAQVDYWKAAFEGLSGRKAGLVKKLNAVEPEADAQRESLKQIRLILGVERNADILPALRARSAA